MQTEEKEARKLIRITFYTKEKKEFLLSVAVNPTQIFWTFLFA